TEHLLAGSDSRDLNIKDRLESSA
ncbi:MAG: hypothetical protein RLZ74_456, partial [Actinomycetota bacterium]